MRTKRKACKARKTRKTRTPRTPQPPATEPTQARTTRVRPLRRQRWPGRRGPTQIKCQATNEDAAHVTAQVVGATSLPGAMCNGNGFGKQVNLEDFMV